jgi:hypothetical protein
MQQLGLKIDRPFASYEYRQGLIRLDSKLAAGVSRAADPGRRRQDARLYGSQKPNATRISVVLSQRDCVEIAQDFNLGKTNDVLVA